MPLFKNKKFGIPLTDSDSGDSNEEKGTTLPWNYSPLGSYLYYNCTVTVMLDSGVVVHHRLPQVNNAPDTLATTTTDSLALTGALTVGVNTYSQDQYQDVLQRMAHSRYWFRMWGQALRVGYKVPIPGMVSVAGVPVVPYDKNPQVASNTIAQGGSSGGIPVWHGVWSLWYTTLMPPKVSYIPFANPTARVDNNLTLPKEMQAPYSQPDDNATSGNGLDGIVTKKLG